MYIRLYCNESGMMDSPEAGIELDYDASNKDEAVEAHNAVRQWLDKIFEDDIIDDEDDTNGDGDGEVCDIDITLTCRDDAPRVEIDNVDEKHIAELVNAVTAMVDAAKKIKDDGK